MKYILFVLGLLSVLTFVSHTVAQPVINTDPAQAQIIVEDLDRFWRAWDLAEQRPDQRREIFQVEYLDAGSAGLQAFTELRIDNVDRLLSAIDAHPH